MGKRLRVDMQGKAGAHEGITICGADRSLVPSDVWGHSSENRNSERGVPIRLRSTRFRWHPHLTRSFFPRREKRSLIPPGRRPYGTRSESRLLARPSVPEASAPFADASGRYRGVHVLSRGTYHKGRMVAEDRVGRPSVPGSPYPGHRPPS